MSTSKPLLHPFGGADWRAFALKLLNARRILRESGSGPKWSSGSGHKLLDLLPFKRWENWAENQRAIPDEWFRWKKTEKHIAGVLSDAVHHHKQVRLLGRGYSFSPLVPTDDYILDLRRMDDCSVDTANKTITAGPATTIAGLHQALVDHNLCLESATVIPWISVGGALGTGAHGTGAAFGTLADLVVNMRVIDAAGNPHVVDGPKGTSLGDEGRALGCNLGALGVVSEVTFQAVDLFNLHAKDDTRNYWMESTMLSRDGMRSLLCEAPYVAALWWPGTERCWVKKWQRTNDPATTTDVQYFLDQLGIWLGAGVVTPIGEVLADHPDWTPIFTSMVFDEIKHQEYISPAPDVFHFLTQYPKVWNMSYAFDVEGYSDAGIDRAVKAWTVVVDKLDEYRAKQKYPLNMAVHMRHIGSSASLLSPSTGHNGSVALEIVTLQGDESGTWSDFFGDVEKEWLDLPGRPHWGKVHGWGNTGGMPNKHDRLDKILSLYPQNNLDTFRRVRQAWDRDHLFQNPYTKALRL